MSDFIGIDATGIPELQAKLAQLPAAVADDGVEAADKQIVNIMQAYGQYHYISRSQVPWASDKKQKQRRYVMAKMREGSIVVPYVRTQGLRNAWKTVGSGKTQIVVNESPYAGFVMGEGVQAHRFSLMGWETDLTRVRTHLSSIVQAFEAGARNAIKRLGLD
jgi:hypothetical protein